MGRSKGDYITATFTYTNTQGKEESITARVRIESIKYGVYKVYFRGDTYFINEEDIVN